MKGVSAETVAEQPTPSGTQARARSVTQTQRGVDQQLHVGYSFGSWPMEQETFFQGITDGHQKRFYGNPPALLPGQMRPLSAFLSNLVKWKMLGDL